MTLSLIVTTADSANMHGFSRLIAENSNGHAWLRLYAKNYLGKEKSELCVHMPLRLAEMIEEAFHEYENWASSQEDMTFDEALGAKCDAEARAKAGAA
jgi:hypothetical protein